MSAPLLLIGIGDQGKRVGGHFARALNEASASLSACTKVLYDPPPQSCRDAIVELSRASAAQGKNYGAPVQAWIVADLAEADIAGRVSSQADQLSDSFQTDFPQLVVNVETVLFLPRAAPVDLTAILALLNKLGNGASPCRFTWLLSNGKHLLDDEELTSVAARFLWLTFIGDLPSRFWARGTLDSLRSRLGTLGLSGIIVPVQERERREAANIAAAVLEEVLTDHAATADPRLFDDFARSSELSLEALKRTLKDGAQFSFAEKDKKINLDDSAPRSWPDRLWSIYYFLAFGGLAGYFDRIDQNREQKWLALSAELSRVVDNQLEKNLRPSTTLALLRQFEMKFADLKGERVSASAGKIPLQNAIESLKQAYHMQSASIASIATRVVFLSLMLGYLLAFVMPWIVEMPETPPVYYFIAFLTLSFVSVGLAALLHYMKKRNRFSEAKAGAETALWTALESALDARAHNQAVRILERLQSTCTPTEGADQAHLSSGADGSEYSHVVAFVEAVRAAAQCLRTIAGQKDSRTALLRYLEPQLVYKDGAHSIAHEAKIFVANGLFKTWRETSAEILADRSLKLAAAGLRGAKTVGEILAVMGDSEVEHVGRDMVERAAPLAGLTSSSAPAVHEERYLFAKDAVSSPLATKSTLRNLTPVATEDAHQLILLRVYLGLGLDDIVGLSSWRGEKTNG